MSADRLLKHLALELIKLDNTPFFAGEFLDGGRIQGMTEMLHHIHQSGLFEWKEGHEIRGSPRELLIAK